MTPQSQAADSLAGYTPDWKQQQTSAQEPDPLAGYTPDWRQQSADPLAGYTPDWRKKLEPGIGEQLLEGLKEQGRSLVQFAKYVLTLPGPVKFNERGLIVPVSAEDFPIFRDTKLAEAGDTEAATRVRRSNMASALVLSTVGAGAAAQGLKAAPLVGGSSRTMRGLRFLTSEAIGGGVYGAVDPGDRDRLEAIKEDALLFPVAGAALHGAFKSVGFLAGKALSQPVQAALAGIKSKPEADAIARQAANIYENVKPVGDGVTREEIVAAQTVAVEAAVNKVDIPARISDPSLPGFPKINPEMRKVWKEMFGAADAKVYAATYNLLRQSDNAESFARQKRLMQAMETRLTPEQRAQLRMIDNAGWEDEIAAAIKDGDILAAADMAVTKAVEETPISAVATPALNAEAAQVRAAQGPKPTQPPVQAETPVVSAFLAANPDAKINSILRDFSGGYEQNRKAAIRRIAIWEAERGSGVPGVLARDIDYATVERELASMAGETHVATSPVAPVRSIHEGFGTEPNAMNSPDFVPPAAVEVDLEQQLRESLNLGAAKARAEAVEAATPEDEVKQAIKDAFMSGNTEPLVNKIFADVVRQREATIQGLRESWKPLFKEMREAEAVGLSDIRPVDAAAPAVPEVVSNPSVLYARASEKVKKLIEDEGAAISAQAARQIGGRALLGGLSAASFGAMDDENSFMANTGLAALGVFLATSAAMPGARSSAWFTQHKFFSKYVKWADVRRYGTTATKEGFDLWHSITNESRARAVLSANKLRLMLSKNPTATPGSIAALFAKTDEGLNKSFGFAADEGALAPEFHLLSPDLQREAISLKMANDANAQWMKQQGYIGDIKENYFKNILPRDTFEHWKAQRAAYKAQNNQQAVSYIETLRGAIDHAKQHGLEGPIENVADAQAKHMVDVGKIVAKNEVRKFFESLNRIVPYDRLQMPQGWRRIGNTNQMAPDDIATVMERIAQPSVDVPFLDFAKGVMMKSIMVFPWEHGINLIRGVAALANPVTAVRAYKNALHMIDIGDPMVLEQAKYMQLFKQPDRLDETGFNALLKKIGLENLTHLSHVSERMLWERWAPATAMAAWSLRMLKWTRRTNGKFPIGSPEYEAAAREAGRFGDTVAGKLPELLQDPKMAAATRLVLFSPAWTRTRISVVMKAAGELQDIATGQINPRDATYLPYKLRAVAFGAAFTWVLSKLWSGEDPQFNPNTTKLYARTGLYDDRGRELGVDLVGWWQDDIKMFTDPLMFFEHRMSPPLRAITQGINKRDAFGNDLSYAENLENIFRQFGPLTTVPDAIVKTASGHMSSREAVKQGSEFLAVGNVSSLPKMSDVVIARMAEKVITSSGLPATRSNVFDLTQMMKQNHKMSGQLVGNNIKSWLAYKRRSYPEHHPIASLWYSGKRLLAEVWD